MEKSEWIQVPRLTCGQSEMTTDKHALCLCKLAFILCHQIWGFSAIFFHKHILASWHILLPHPSPFCKCLWPFVFSYPPTKAFTKTPVFLPMKIMWSHQRQRLSPVSGQRDEVRMKALEAPGTTYQGIPFNQKHKEIYQFQTKWNSQSKSYTSVSPDSRRI